MGSEVKRRRAFLKGDTYNYRGTLNGNWRWDTDKKVWWRDGGWENEAQIREYYARPGSLTEYMKIYKIWFEEIPKDAAS